MAIRWLIFALTDRCQLDCTHCLRDPALRPSDLPLELLERVLEQGQRFYSCAHAALTGGEPTLHPEFGEVVRTIVRFGYTWHVVTNGQGFEKRLLPVLEEERCRAGLTVVDFSLDGADEAVHDQIRGAGSFRAVMQAVTACHARNIPFVLQLTLNALNAHQLETFRLLATQLGARSIGLNMLQPTGTPRDEQLFLPASAWRDLADRIQRLGEALRIQVNRSEGFYTAGPFHTCNAYNSELLNVDSRGNLALCCQLSEVPGPSTEIIADLKDVSLPEAHGRMLTRIFELQLAKNAAIAAGKLDDEWDRFPCTYCLRQHGKPHWTAEGRAGAPAVMERWRGRVR